MPSSSSAHRQTIDSLRASLEALSSSSASPSSPAQASPSSSSPRSAITSAPEPSPSPSTSLTPEANEILQRILTLCGYRDYSRKKMADRLRREKHDPALCEEALDRACALGLINDARFADILIRSRLQQGRGSAGIERELRENAIEPSTVAGWPEDYLDGEEAELSQALALLERHPPRSKRPRDSAYRRLVNKGYRSSIASEAARLWFEGQLKASSDDAAIL